MDGQFLNLTRENLEKEHLCCAISDKKHQAGVCAKKEWLQERIGEGHIFRKLDAKGKVFIEYAPLETAWVPILGENYLYIYCLWVAGSYSGKGYGKALMQHCIQDAKQQGKAGVCILSSKKKKPFLSDKKFLFPFGFRLADTAGDDYELMALPFGEALPRFTEQAKRMKIDQDKLTIYYSPQCPYILNCVTQVQEYCGKQSIPLALISVDSLEKAKSLPCVFNNWAAFYHGDFFTHHPLNETLLKKMLEKNL